MTIPATTILWIFIGLFTVLIGIAIAHVVQGMRYGGGSATSTVATLLFIIVVLACAGGSGFLLRDIDWSASWTIGVTSYTDQNTSQ